MDSLENKIREVEAAGLLKRAKLADRTPAEQLRTEFASDLTRLSTPELRFLYGRDAVREVQAWEDAQQDRTLSAVRIRSSDELAKDVPLSLAGGAVNLVGGAALLAGDLSARAHGAVFGDEWEGTLRDTILNPSTNLLTDFNKWREESSSLVKQADSAIMSEENLAAAAESEAQYDRDFQATAGQSAVSQLASGFAASARRLGRDFVQGAGNMFNHPTSLVDAAIEQVPTLGLGAVAKGALTAEAVAARGSAIALMREKQGLEALSAPALRELAETQLVTRNLAAGVGATEAGSIYAQEAGEILDADFRKLYDTFPQVREQVDAVMAQKEGDSWNTMDEGLKKVLVENAISKLYDNDQLSDADRNKIKSALASEIGLTSAAIVAPLAALAGRASAGLQRNPLGLPREGVRTVAAQLRRDAKDVAGEVLEETIQGGVSETAGNIAKFLAGDENADILEGAGTAAGQGAATAGAFAGALRAPSVLASGVGGAAKAIGQGILDVGAERQEKIEARTVLERERVNVATETAADTVVQAAQALAPETRPERALSAVQGESLLDPEDVASVQRGDATTARVQAATRLLSRLTSEPGLDPQKKLDYRLFIGKVVRELRQDTSKIADPDLAAQITQLTENPAVRTIEQAFAKVDPAVLENLTNALPENLADDVDLTPEQAKSAAQAVEMAFAAPDQMGKPLAMKALSMAKRLRPEEVKQLELAVKVAENKEQHEAKVDEIKGKYKSSKAAPSVRHEIEQEGFNTGYSYKSSLSDYVRNVSTAVQEGRIQDAKTEMGKLQTFARHMQKRAESFDEAATRQVAEGMQDKPYEVAVGGTIKDGELDLKSKFKLNLAPGSRSEQGGKATMEYVFADANSVAQTYNTLIEQYPELVSAAAQDQVPLQPERFATDLKPTYNTARSREEAAERLASKKPKEGKTETKTAPTSEPAPKGESAPTVETTPAPEPAPAEEGPPWDLDDKTNVVRDVPPKTASKEKPAPAPEPVAEEVLVPTLSVDFQAAPTEEATADLQKALAMTDAEYLAVVNPEGKTTEVPSDQAINEELADTEPSSRATVVGQVGDVTLMADGDYLYAVQNEETVGLLVNKEGGSQLYVHSSQRGKGLGKAMIRELLIRNPFALTNGLSSAARATRLSVLRDLRAEAAGSAAPVVAPMPTAESPTPPAEPIAEPIPEAPQRGPFVAGETTPDGWPLNSGQKTAFQETMDFLRDVTAKTHAIIGSAGTGKTTLINTILDLVAKDPSLSRREIILTSPTHRANSVIESKNPDKKVKTIHKLLKLRPDQDLAEFDASKVEFVKDYDVEAGIPAGAIMVIDESSMINDDLYAMLLDAAEQAGNVKVIFMGDSAQLSPVKSETDSKALTNTDSKSELTQVMRAKNPELLNESVAVRTSGKFTNTTAMKDANGVRFMNGYDEFLSRVVRAFKSESFKTNPLLLRVVSAMNARVENFNRQIRAGVFGENAAPYELGELLMGYNTFGKPNYATGKTPVANGVDYVVVAKSPERTQRIGGIDVQVQNLSLKNVISGKVEEVPVVLPSNSEETFLAIANKMNDLLDEMNRVKYGKRLPTDSGKTAGELYGQFLEIKNSWVYPRDIDNPKRKAKLVKKTIDYGYAHTIHKSQGGTYTYVFVDGDSIDMFKGVRERPRLRYVGVTRAERGAFILTDNAIKDDVAAVAEAPTQETVAEAVTEPEVAATEPTTAPPSAGKARLDSLVQEGKATIRNGVYYVTDPEATTYMAGTTRDGSIYVNIGKSAQTDLADYMQDSEQKRAVLAKLNVTAEQFASLFMTPQGINRKAVNTFLMQHEKSHLENQDSLNYPKKENGKYDLMHPDAIAIETRATLDALTAEQLNNLAQMSDVLPGEAVAETAEQPEAQLEEELRDGEVVEAGEPTEAIPAEYPLALGLMTALRGSKNKFLTAFRLLKSKNSLFARMGNPLEKLRQALEKNDPESLLLEKDQHLRFSDDQFAGLANIVERFAPAIIDMLNKNLNDAARGQGLDARGNPRKGKGFIDSILNPAGSNIPAWDYPNRQSLHVVTESNGKLAYQPEVAQAMALAAIHWMLRTVALPPSFKIESVASMFEDGIIPPNLRELYESAHYYEQPLRNLAQDITRTLGLQADPDAPRDQSEGIAKALAADAARALSNLGMLDVTYARGPGEADFAFLKFNTESANSLETLRTTFGNLNALTRLLMPDSAQLPSIGAAPTSIPTRTTGSNHPLSKKLRENIRNKQNIPFVLNQGLLEFLNLLSPERIQDLTGYRDVVLDDLNKNDRMVVEGTNRGIEMSWANFRNILHEMEAYAKANNIPVSEVPVYYAWRVTSNTRMMMNGPSPQSDKLIRELLTANKKTIDLADPKMVNEYHMTIAQALGIKTEQMTNQQAIMETQQGFQEGGKYYDVVQNIKALLADTQNADLKRQVFEQMRDLKIDNNRAINALYTQAKFETNSEATFEHSIPFELDGKTDGPIHALMHFGLQSFSTKMLKQLRQGGVFINEAEKTTLNQWGSSLGDLYSNASATMTDALTNFMANKKGPIRDIMIAALAQMRQLDYTTSEDDADPFSSMKASRSLSKLAFAPMIYGSSAHSIHVKLADEITKSLYAQLSQAIADGQPLSNEVQWDIAQLMGQRPIFNDRKQVVGYAKVSLPSLNNLAAYKKLTFSEENFRALVANLQTTAGGQLTTAVENEVGPVLDTFKKLYAASLLQTVALRHAFKTKVEARRQELIAKKELGYYEALSPNEEAKILDSLSHLVPAYALMNSAQGVNTAVKDFSGTFSVDGEVRKTASIAGGLALDISATEFANPGVRAAALYVIALGDATMMSEVFNQVRDMLDVFDGLEVSVGSIDESSVLVNKAVHDAMRFDALQSIVDSFARMTLPLEEMTPAEIQDLVKNMRVLPAGADLSNNQENIDTIRHHISLLEMDLAQQARTVRTYKQVFDELPGSNGHMAGSMTVYTYPGTSEQVPVGDEDTVAWIEERVAAKLAQEDLAEAEEEDTTAAALEVTAVTEPEPQQQSLWAVNHMNREQVMDMIKKNPFKNPVRQFVFSRIAHLLPKNLALYSGSRQEMEAKQREIFPNVTFHKDSDGWFYGDSVFLVTGSEETLLHELVHSAVETVLLQFYKNAGKGLTALQREGMSRLDELTQAFVELDLTTWDDSQDDSVFTAQKVVQAHWANGDKAEAVSEFIAWVTTNEEVHAALKQTAGIEFLGGLRTLAKRVREFVRKLLGLPANNAMDMFLEQALVAFEAVTRETGTNFNARMLPLNHSMGGTPAVGGQNVRLQDLAQQFAEMLAYFPNDGRDRDVVLLQHIEPAILAADRIRDAFTDAGFTFTPQEENAFKKLQALFASTIQLDANTLATLQNIYNTVMPKLSATDFLDDPLDTSAPAMAAAQKRFKALSDVRTKHVDALGRSNALANFVSLALVYEPLRTKLSGLAVPKSKIEGENLDQKIRSAATAAFDWMSKTASLANQAQNQRQAIDLLMGRLYQNQKAMVSRAGAKPSVLTKAEQQVSRVVKNIGEKADAKLRERHTAGLMGGTNSWVNAGLNMVRAMGTPDNSEATAEAILEWSNESNFPKPLRQLINEFTGVTKSTYPVVELLNLVRHEVSRVRQRLRDEVPDQVRGLFTQKLSPEQWTSLHRLVGKADFQALFGPFSISEIRGFLRDPGNLAAAITRLEAQLGPHGVEQAQAAKDLAAFMMNHQNPAKRFLWRNADAISQMAGTGRQIAPAEAERLVPVIDALITLRAVELFSAPEKAFLGGLMDTDEKGVKGLVRLMRTLNQAEFAKPDYQEQALNRWKGYVPASLDPRDTLVLANLQEGEKLVKQGYRRLEAYQGDALDPNQGLHYYAVTWSGGQATYNQGAIQTVEGSVGGVDRLTGRTLDPGVGTMITDVQTVGRITNLKMRGQATGNHNLLPIFDNQGHVVAYERVLDPGLLDTHLTGKKDLAQSIGMWMGRQAEENIARHVNKGLVDVLKESWNKGVRAHRQAEYVDVSSPTASATTKETWEAIPRETQDLLKTAFGNGPVMVRLDMMDNALGYRSASIGNVFTGMTDLPEPAQKAIRDAAFGLLGERAYQKLVVAERAWQNLVATAKDIIVVRSGMVALANGVANQFQLVQMGVPINQLIQSQARKIRETETYLRNERRLAQLQFEKAAAHGPKQRDKLDQEIQALEDANRRLSIWPLIAAGHLPTIAEGLTEQDEYTIMKDFVGWIESKTKDVPEGLTTAAKYALITKDTALYLGLNRMIQFGDFMAKAVTYDHYISQGMTQEDAVYKVNETFVNYNLLAGRSRDYLESMGLTWFMNYKIRIAKIVGRTLRDNPLRFLMAGVGAEVAGADSLMSSNPFTMNLSYATGTGQFFQAHNAILWEQMMDSY